VVTLRYSSGFRLAAVQVSGRGDTSIIIGLLTWLEPHDLCLMYADHNQHCCR
jgi:hypothetical protein